MKDDFILENDKLTLRPISTVANNISNEHIVSIADDYDIAKYVGHRFPNPYTLESSEGFKKYALESWVKGSEFTFAIFRKSNNEYMGNIGVALNKEDNMVSNLGYWLGKKYSGNNYMTQAVKLVLDFCFNELKVRRIDAGVYEGNIASQKVLENNGFIKEGLRRKKYVLRTGEILDEILYGLLKEEYKK